jgi:isopentenyldiphosphate isomerase
MAVEIDKDVAANYEQIHKERGISWEQLAESVEANDKQLAAWMRGKAAEEDERSSADAPKARKAAAPTSTASGDEGDAKK